MRVSVAVFVLFSLIGNQAYCQQEYPKKSKTYQARIVVNNKPVKPRGFLWQVSDSSVFLVQSFISPEPREYRFNEIKLLKIRRDHSVRRSAITGSVIGAATGIILINTVEGGLSFLALPASTLAGLVFGAVGGGFGALTGTISDRIPINGDPEKFSLYKGSLLDYSLQREQISAPGFVHRGYFGTEAGISFAGGEFASLSAIPMDGYISMDKTGFAFSYNGGYRLHKNFAVNLSLTGSEFSLNLSSGPPSEEYAPGWSFTSLLIGPVISLPLDKNWSFDLTPGIGYAGTTLTDGVDFILNGDGLGYQLKGAFSNHYAKRFTASFGGSYFSSNVKYREGGSGKASSFSLLAGLIYRFGKKSL